MIINTFEQTMEKFQEAAARFNEADAKAIDSALVPVMLHHDVRCIRPLLLSLNDVNQQDEGMFSIIHAAESFDDDTYVSELFLVLPELRASAPKWASIILMRGLNNESTKNVMVRKLRDMNSDVKETVIWLCEKINERSTSFLNKTLPLLLAAK